MIERNFLETEIERVCDRVKHELWALLLSRTAESKNDDSPTPQLWMTAAQLAEYWQFVHPDGKPRTAGILKWTKRRPNEFPLPHAQMGDLMRFNREDVDKWAKEEAERRRIQNERKRLKIA